MSKFETGGKMRLPMFLGKDASGAPLIDVTTARLRGVTPLPVVRRP